MKSTKAIVFGFFLSLIGLTLIGFAYLWFSNGSFDNAIIAIANYSTAPLGSVWAIIGYGLMNGKKWLAEKSTRLLRGSLALIILQIILCAIGYIIEYDDSMLQSFDFTIMAIVVEAIFYLVLLLPILKSKKVQESLFR